MSTKSSRHEQRGSGLAAQAAFLALDQAFQGQQDRSWAEEVRRKGQAAGTRAWPGCTAIAALLVHSRLWVANAGQSSLSAEGANHKRSICRLGTLPCMRTCSACNIASHGTIRRELGAHGA